MNKRQFAALAACAGLALSATPQAAAEDGFSGGVKFSSHYAWQGHSESNEVPVLQGSIYYNMGSCYGGLWGSGTGTAYGGTEIDIEFGCGGSFSETFGWDVTLLVFTYPDALPGDNATIVEPRFKVSADLGPASVWARVGLPKWDSYSANAANDGGHYRPNIGVSVPLGSEIPLSLSATYGMDKNRPNGDDYSWYHVSADTSIAGLGVSVFYSKRGERDPKPNGDIVPAEDGVIGVSVSRSF